MTYKALLADDSLTIQKVIKITLAHEPFELTICQSEDQLREKLGTTDPAIIFLDFSLSDNKSGYQLCSELVKMKPTAKVLMLYGTFDNIDEAALNSCGAADRIIKPFDSVKFVDICKKLVEGNSSQKTGLYDLEKSFGEVDSSDENDWVLKEEKVTVVEPVENDLSNVDEMEDWGVPVPGVIIEDGNEDHLEVTGAIPGVIPGKEEIKLEAIDSINLPKNEDLEYPDLESPKISLEVPSKKQPPKLQSLEVLAEIEDDDQPISLEEVLGTKTEAEVKLIEDVISDEIQDEDLWGVDEDNQTPELNLISELKSVVIETEQVKIAPVLESIKHTSTEQIQAKSDALSESDLEKLSDRLYHRLKNEIEKQLKLSIESTVREACRETVDNVVWEVIPDLAENIIKNEIAKISNSVMED